MESAGTSTRRLPTWNTWFVGREAELAAATAVFDERRLVTFVGPGGCGKTRLAVELARALALRLPDGVHSSTWPRSPGPTAWPTHCGPSWASTRSPACPPTFAASMFVSTATVKTHLIRIFRKLEVRNRAELAAQARDRT